MLRDQIMLVLSEANRPYTPTDITSMIEGANHEDVATLLAELEEESKVMGLRNIDNDDIGYNLL